MTNQRDPTLQMLAQHLGIHVSTVSRVLNGSDQEAAKAASAKSIARIKALAEEWEYRPNPHAISLRKSRSNLIGVIVPRISDLVLAFIYEGIEQTALDHSYFTFVTNSYNDPQTQLKQIRTAQRRRVDGLILGDAHMDAAMRPPLSTLRMPFVLVNRRSGTLPSVTCNDYLGGCLAAEHLLQQGHTCIGIVAGLSFTSTGQERAAGFIDTCRERGVHIPPDYCMECSFDTAAGHATAARLLTLRPQPSAIFAVNDFGAIGAMGAVRAASLRVGPDIAVVGFNDTPLAAELPVPLTSIRSPLHEMGAKSMELLLSLLQGEYVESIRLQPEIIIRASSLGK